MSEDLYTALRAADAAGDIEGAQRLASYIGQQGTPTAASAQPAPDKGTSFTDTAGDFGAGLVRGLHDVIDRPAELLASGFDGLTGSHEHDRIQAMDEAGKSDFQAQHGDSTAASIGRAGGQVAATLPVGGFLGTAVRTAGAAGLAPAIAVPLGEAIATGGLRASGAGLATRTAGGAINGAVTAAAADPDAVATGAATGAAVPVAGKVLGAAGRVLSGPVVSQATRNVARDAIDAGFVVPPTSVKPSFGNRALEGLAGKLSTAQNASVKNQAITNELARNAIGASDLTPQGLQAVRDRANQAYDLLGRVGQFKTDISFKAQIAKLGAGNRQLAQNFPGLADQGLDDLVNSFLQLKQFDAQSGLEAVKRLRADAVANTAAIGDPTKKALGRVQHQVAGAIEDLIDRNLRRSGSTQLLDNFRTARRTLAMTHDVEKATNPATQNVDASKLAQILKKGRPLSGGLRQVGEFASAFPKAVQTPEGMGSLPQTSPLDWGAAALTAAAGAGGPLSIAALAARPAARGLALSGPVQRGLTRAPRGFPVAATEAAPFVARGLPVAATEQDD